MPAQESITARVLRIAAACVFTLSITAATAAAQCTIEWTGASGNWNEAARWSTGSVPADTDDVCIQAAGTYTVVLSTNATVASLTLGDGSGEQTLSITSGTLALTGNGTIGSNGVIDFASGTLDGGSGLTNEGLIVLTTGSDKTLHGTLRNQGTIDWQQGNLYLATGALIENRETFRAAANSGIHQTGGEPQRFENLGTLLKVEPQTTSIIDIEFDNRGSLDVSEGTLRFTDNSEHTGVSLEVRADATLEFSNGTHLLSDIGLAVPSGATVTFDSGTRIITGTLAGDVQGLVQWTSGTTQAGPAGGTIDISGSGLRWQGGDLSTPNAALTNRGTIHLVGTGNKNITSGTFRNEGTMTWTEGRLNIPSDGVFENGGSVILEQEQAVIGPEFNPGWVHNEGRFERAAGEGLINVFPQFENRAEGELAIQSGLFLVRSMRNLEGGTISGDGGHLDVIGTFLNEGIISPGTSPGRLSFTGTYRAGATSELRIEIGGTEPGVDHDQFYMNGVAYLDGLLDVSLLDGYRPADGTAFTVLYLVPSLATKTENTHPVYGGFRERHGLVDVLAGLALYPSITSEGVVLTAGPLVELASEISIEPDQLTSSGVRTVTITGEGFSPDITVALECVECGDPEGQGTIAGTVGTISATDVTVSFDLLEGEIWGDYEVVVRDPRGGEARAPLVIVEGPVIVSVYSLEAETVSGGDTPGLFLIRTNRPLKTALHLPFFFDGSARQFVDFVPDVLGSTIEVPVGRDSVTVAIHPLRAETGSRNVMLLIQRSQPPLYGMPAPLSAEITVHGRADHPPELRVLTAHPRSGGNIGTVTLTVAGQGFTPQSTVQLTGGGASINADDVQVNEVGTVLTAIFRLDGQTIGMRNIVVQDGNGSATLTSAFSVEAGIFPDVHIDLLAPERVPRTRLRTYTLQLRNLGNVDVSGTPYLAGLPADAEWRFNEKDFDLGGLNAEAWHQLAVIDERDGVRIVALPPVTVRPGITRSIDIDVAFPTPETVRLMGLWTY